MDPQNIETEGGFLNAVARGVDQTQATLFSFADILGELTGIDWLEEFGEEGVARQIEEMIQNPAEVQRWDDVDGLASFATWAVERLGEQVPNIAMDLALYAAAGVLATPTGGSSIAAVVGAKGAQHAALAQLGKKLKRTAVAAGQRKVGLSAVATSAAIQGAGETQLELAAEGVEAPVTALFTGLAKGGLDAAGLDRIFKSARRVGQTPGSLVDIAATAVKETGLAAGFEGLTEGVQTVLDKVAVSSQVEGYDIFSRDNWAEIIESAAAGTLVGGATSGTLGGANAIQQAFDSGDLDGYTALARSTARDVRDAALNTFDEFGPAFQRNEDGSTSKRPDPQPTPEPPAQPVNEAPTAVQEHEQANRVADVVQDVETANVGAVTQNTNSDRIEPEAEERPNQIAGEPLGDTQAQLDLTRDPNSTKRATVITPDTDITQADTSGLERTDILIEESDQPYTIFTRQGDGTAQQLQERGDTPLSTVELGNLLTTPELAQSKGDGSVVQARDADGNVSAEVATTQEQVGTAITDLQEQAPGQEIVVTDVLEGLQRRAQRITQEREGPNSVADVLSQIRRLSPDNQQELLGDIRTPNQLDTFINALDKDNVGVDTTREQEIADADIFEIVNDTADVQTNDFTDINAAIGLFTPASGLDDVNRKVKQPEYNVKGNFNTREAAQAVVDSSVYNPNRTLDVVAAPGGFAVQTTYAQENISGEQTVQRRGAPSVLESERFSVGIKKAKENGAKGRGALNKDAIILVGAPGSRVKRPMALMDLTMAGANVREATGVAANETTAESLLAGLALTLGEMQTRGMDVSDAFVDSPAGPVLRPELIFEHGNLKTKPHLNRTVGSVIGEGSEKQARNQAFAALADAQREVVAANADRSANSTQEFEAAEDRRRSAFTNLVDTRNNVEQNFAHDTSANARDTVNEQETLHGEDEIDSGVLKPENLQRKDTFATFVSDDVRDDRWVKSLEKSPQRRTPLEAVRVFGDGMDKEAKLVRGIFEEIGLAMPVVLVEGNTKNLRAWHADQKRKNKFDKRHIVMPDEKLEKLIVDFKEDRLNGRVFSNFKTSGNSAFIFVRPIGGRMSAGDRLYTVAHETGHVILNYARTRATPEQRRRLKKAWEKDIVDARVAGFERGIGKKTNNWTEKTGFDEWFADKVAARAVNINKKAVKSGLADRFITEAAKLMNKAWNAAKSRMPKRFHINRTVDSVIEEWKSENVFKSEVVGNPAGFQSNDDYIRFDGRTVDQFINKLEISKFTRAFREGFQQMAGNPATRWLFTTDGQLRTELPELAKMLYQRTNEVVHKQSFQGGIRVTRDRWIGEVQQTLRKYTPEQREQIFYALTTEQNSSLNGVQELRDIISKYYTTYLGRNLPGLPEEIKNYFPRDYITAAIEARMPEFIKIIEQDYNVNNALGVAQTLAKVDVQYTARTQEEMFAGWQMERTIVDPKVVKELVDKGFLNANPEMGLARYIEKTSRRAEYSRLFGGFQPDASGHEVWNPNAKLDQMINVATEGGKDTAKAARIRNLVSHTVFHQPVDTDSLVYNVVGEIRAFESLRVLAGSGIASIPEVAAIFARTKGSLSIKEFMGQFGDTIKNYKDAKEVAMSLGVVRNQMSSAMMTEMLMNEGDTQRGGFRKFLPALFKYNGNDAVVNYSRTLAVAVGVEFIQNEAAKAKAGDKRAQRYLEELNIGDPEIVLRWKKNGGLKNLWSSSLRGQAAIDTQTVQDGINRFVTEGVLHPNSSERPTWTGSPLGSLVFHLKTFAYTFSKNVLGGMYRELDARAREGDSPSKSALEMLRFAGPAMFVFMVFGAISEEIRQRVFSLGERGGAKRAKYDASEYLKNITSRSGLFTVPFAEIVTGRGDVVDRAAYVAGPSIHHVYGTLFDDKSATSKLVNAVPILSQFPTVRREIYDSLE